MNGVSAREGSSASRKASEAAVGGTPRDQEFRSAELLRKGRGLQHVAPIVRGPRKGAIHPSAAKLGTRASSDRPADGEQPRRPPSSPAASAGCRARARASGPPALWRPVRRLRQSDTAVTPLQLQLLQ
eukprot:187174-Prymnesium_polylepis.1